MTASVATRRAGHLNAAVTILVAVLLAVFAVRSFFDLFEYRRHQDTIDADYILLDHLDQLQAALSRAASAKRAYFLTGNPAQAATCRALFDKIQRDLPTLGPAAAADYQSSIAELTALTTARLNLAHALLAEYESGRQSAVITMMADDQYLAGELRVDEAYRELSRQLRLNLQTNTSGQQAHFRELFLLIGGGSIATALLLLPYGLFLNRYLARLRATEATLQLSNEFTTSLLRTIPLPMDIVDRAGMVLYQNEPMLRIRGDHAVGHLCWHTMHADGRQCADCPLRTDMPPGETRQLTTTNTRDGRTYSISHTGMNYAGQPAMLEIFHDITEQAQAAEQLRRYAQQLEWNNLRLEDAVVEAQAASRAKDSFLASMSHELRTPLNSIIGFSGVLLKNPPAALDGDNRLFVERIDANGRHLLATINDILDISKIEAGRISLLFTEIDLIPLVNEVLAQTSSLRSDRVQLLAVLPPAPVMLYTDRQRLTQILLNLVGNALKFTEQGTVTVQVATDPATGVPVSIAVSDTGIGIAAEHIERLFNPFFQVDTGPSRRYSGTGLGLTIVKTLASQLNCTIAVASVPGRGSTFTIRLHPYLPLSPAAPAAPAATAATRPPAESAV